MIANEVVALTEWSVAGGGPAPVVVPLAPQHLRGQVLRRAHDGGRHLPGGQQPGGGGQHGIGAGGPPVVVVVVAVIRSLWLRLSWVWLLWL